MTTARGASRRARLLTLGAAALAVLLFGVVVPLPRILALRFGPPSTTAFLEARRAQLLSEGKSARIDRRPVSLEKVSPHLVTAVLVSEDSRFFEHHGIDWGAVQAARTRNRRFPKRRPLGASTITQQLAKNLFLTRERSYRRKLQEAALALHLESTLGKRRILEIYLNVIEWGPGLHGLGPAARHYFGKNPQDLTPREGAFLVALIPGPVKYQPSFASGVLSRGFTRLVNGVLRRLASVGMLTPEELKTELETPLRLRWTPPDAPGEEPLAGGAEADALEPDEEVLDEDGTPASDVAGTSLATTYPVAPGLPTPFSSAAPAASPVPTASPATGPAATPTSPPKESPAPTLSSPTPASRPTPRGTAPPG